MKIIITGASGLMGACVSEHFLKQGHEIIHISRYPKIMDKVKVITWDQLRSDVAENALEGAHIVIHLAGASIASRWTKKYKEILKSSRIQSTAILCRALALLKNKPELLISASAIGYYGNHPFSAIKDETSVAGNDFLSKLCQDWEMQTKQAEDTGIRVVHMRSGVVLSKKGGALAKMLPAFQMGLGGVLGDGQQMMSWIALAEIPYIIEHLIHTKSLSGPVNVVSPIAVSNQVFTKTLGAIIKRPTIFPVPNFIIKGLLGEMGQMLLLEGANVRPLRLLNSGYRFRYDELMIGLISALK